MLRKSADNIDYSKWGLTPQLYVLNKYHGRSKHLETGPDVSTVKLHPLNDITSCSVTIATG